MAVDATPHLSGEAALRVRPLKGEKTEKRGGFTEREDGGRSEVNVNNIPLEMISR